MTRVVAFLAAAGLATAASAQFSINELRIDQGGSDASEYFEIAGQAGASLDGMWYVVIGDDGGDGSGNPGSRSGSVEAAVDLSGLVMPADGYFLAAESSFGTGGLGLTGDIDLLLANFELNFENSDNVSHLLVSGFTGAIGDLLDTNRDGTLDITPWSAMVDGISLIEKPFPDFESDEFNYGFGGGIGPDGTFVPGHIYRFANGSGPWNIGAFSGGNDTPGTANIPAPGALALLALGGMVSARRRR